MIEQITEAEFVVARGSKRGMRGEPSELTKAVRLLELGQGFKLPCCNTHYSKNSCGRAQRVYRTARDAGFKINVACRDGVLYVFRPKEDTHGKE